MAREEAKVTEGRDGARNLKVQWIDMHLPDAKSCRFSITTSAANAIEAVMEQSN